MCSQLWMQFATYNSRPSFAQGRRVGPSLKSDNPVTNILAFFSMEVIVTLWNASINNFPLSGE
jgi:hypothetical protein